MRTMLRCGVVSLVLAVGTSTGCINLVWAPNPCCCAKDKCCLQEDPSTAVPSLGTPGIDVHREGAKDMPPEPVKNGKPSD
jgi:hypothetical protein